jgi:membrane protease YdiL (CAAX protease family)
MEIERRVAATAGALGLLAFAWLLLASILEPTTEVLGSILFTQLLFAALAIVATVWATAEGTAAYLGLRRSRLPATAALLGIVAILAWSYGLHGLLVAAELRETGNLARIDELVRAGGEAHAAVTLLAVCVAPALGEELLFRGFVFGAAERAGGAGVAVLVSAALFGAVHGDLPHGSVAFVIGIGLGALRMASGSVWLPMAAHLVNNGFGAMAELARLEIPGTGWEGGVAALLAGAGLLAHVARAGTKQVSPGPMAPTEPAP